jgi:PPOX class probable F420-dependent enzyme
VVLLITGPSAGGESADLTRVPLELDEARDLVNGRGRGHLLCKQVITPGSASDGDQGVVRSTRPHYGSFVRTNLALGDLGDLLDEPLVAVLATLRADGSVLLSPVYHEWRDGGFNVWVEEQNVKARHLRRDPRATILVAESEPPLRAIEVRGSARFIEQGVSETALRIATRYLGPEDAAADVEALRGADVIVRIEPGDIRVWDYVDEYTTD